MSTTRYPLVVYRWFHKDDLELNEHLNRMVLKSQWIRQKGLSVWNGSELSVDDTARKYREEMAVAKRGEPGGPTQWLEEHPCGILCFPTAEFESLDLGLHPEEYGSVTMRGHMETRKDRPRISLSEARTLMHAAQIVRPLDGIEEVGFEDLVVPNEIVPHRPADA